MKSISVILILDFVLLLVLGIKSPCNLTSSIDVKLNYIWEKTLFVDGIDGSKGPFTVDTYTINDSIRVYGCITTDYHGNTIKVLSIEQNDTTLLEKEVSWMNRFYYFDQFNTDLTNALNTVISEKKKWYYLW